MEQLELDLWPAGERNPKNNGLPPPKLDWSQRRMSYCQADEDDCTYEHCPRWQDGKLINEAHCALDLIGRDDEV